MLFHREVRRRLIAVAFLGMLFSQGLDAENNRRSWFVSTDGADITNCGETLERPCKTIRYAVLKSSNNDLINLRSSENKHFDIECGRNLDTALPIKRNITIQAEMTQDNSVIMDCQSGYGFFLNASLTLKHITIKNAYVAFIHNIGVLTLVNVTILENYFGITCPGLLPDQFPHKNSSVQIRATKCRFLNNTRSISTLDDIASSSKIACADILDVKFDWCVIHSSPFVFFARNNSSIISKHTYYYGARNLTSEARDDTLFLYTIAKKNTIRFYRCSFDGFVSSTGQVASLIWIGEYLEGSSSPPARDIDISFIDIVFQNSQSLEGSPIFVGGGCDRAYGRFSFENCTFRNNIGLLAGAVVISDNMRSCSIQLKECNFENNVGLTVGGAVKIGKFTQVSIASSRFSNQSSLYAGGTIYSESSLTLFNTTFENSVANHSKQGDIFYGSGKIVLMGDVYFKARHAVDDSAIFWTDFAIVKIRGNLTLVCPEKRLLYEVSALPLNPKSQAQEHGNYSMLAYYCRACDTGEYTLNQGTVSTAGTTHKGRCYPCPFGGVCRKGNITAKPRFWGYTNLDAMLKFSTCPTDYCCSNTQECLEYNSCRPTRGGTLCGECLPGYSETLLSPSCEKDEKCHDIWVWFVALILVVTFVLFLLYTVEIEAVIYHQIFWWQKTKTNGIPQEIQASNGSSEMEDLSQTCEIKIVEKSNGSDGYLVIIFYYYQAASFLRIHAVFHNNSKHATPLSSLLALMKLQPFFVGSSLGDLCPVVGLTALGKTLILGFSTVLPPIIVLGAVYVIYCTVKWYRARKCRAMEHSSTQVCRDDSTLTQVTQDYQARCVKTLLSLFLLSYASLASMTFTLLHCVQVGNVQVLYSAGYIRCYQPWQHFFVVYAAVAIFPLWIVVGAVPYLVRKGLASTKEVILACLFPLPLLILWLMKWLKKNYYGLEFQPLTIQQLEIQLHMISVIEGPFLNASCEEGLGPVYWQGVFTARRLVLVSINVFVHDPAIRLLCLTMVCLFILLHHLWVKPFNSQPANNLEMVSLASLTILALMNLIKGVLNSSGYEIRSGGELEKLVEATDWWESIVLWLPLALVILLLLLSQVLRLAMNLLNKIRDCSN